MQKFPCQNGGDEPLGAFEAKFWANFCHALDREDWIGRQCEPLPQAALTAEVPALFGARPRAH